jgi:drug/metabolite transporter (DMT)-like permease
MITVYILGGSTYLAIRFAIETIPPFLMAGSRFLVAGAILYAVRRVRGVQDHPVGSGVRLQSSGFYCSLAGMAVSSGRNNGWHLA